MLHLTKDELRLGREQDWGVLFWNLFRYSKAVQGEILAGEDITNAFYLGDEHVGQLVGRGPVAKSIRYLLRQCDQSYELEQEDEDPPPDAAIPDVQLLLDYWSMAEQLGRNLSNDRVRFPHNLIAAHDEAAAQMRQREEDDLANQFRIRWHLLRRWAFEADGSSSGRPGASGSSPTRATS